MKIYIAGPISGLDYEKAKANFETAEEFLRILGYEPVNPMKENGLDGDGEEHPWVEYMKRDIPLLMNCEGIYLLFGWWNSRGANVEHRLARDLGFKVLHELESIPPVNGAFGAGNGPTVCEVDAEVSR